MADEKELKTDEKPILEDEQQILELGAVPGQRGARRRRRRAAAGEGEGSAQGSGVRGPAARRTGEARTAVVRKLRRDEDGGRRCRAHEAQGSARQNVAAVLPAGGGDQVGA